MGKPARTHPWLNRVDVKARRRQVALAGKRRFNRDRKQNENVSLKDQQLWD